LAERRVTNNRFPTRNKPFQELDRHLQIVRIQPYYANFASVGRNLHIAQRLLSAGRPRHHASEIASVAG
jgi:hypothetical protein